MDTAELYAKYCAMEEHFKHIDQEIAQIEKRQEDMNELTITVSKLADNMKSMLDEQRSQNDRLKLLEDRPAKAWNTMQKTIFTTVVSALAGGLVGILGMAIAQYLH
ncbi:MAG TPA: hypothetical protein DD632_04305 [Oribacterium sp.]|nr:hypothetical protein [Oribacterium sp.]